MPKTVKINKFIVFLNSISLKSTAPFIFLFLGTGLLILSTSHWYLRLRSLTPNMEIVEVKVENRDLPVHINIPWKVDVDVVPSIIEDNRWSIAENAASVLVQSALPGEKGNVIVYGHNKREILGNIRAMKKGEIITLVTQLGKEYKYEAREIIEVSPTQTSYLEASSEEVLTLYTCSGLLDSKRFIVRAFPI